MGLVKKPTYAIVVDWLVIILLNVVYFLMHKLMNINQQCIPDHNDCGIDEMKQPTPLLAYPYQKSNVPVYYPYLFGFTTWLFVVVVFIIVHLCSNRHLPLRKYELQTILIKIESLFREQLTSLIITQSVVIWIKKYVGRPRPFFYEYFSVDPKDALESFPSGHTSSSFCIHILLMYHVISAMNWSYNIGNNKIEVENMHSIFGAKIWVKLRYYNNLKVIFIMALLALPIWISCSRVIEYYHTYADIICGALIGTFVSSIVFIIFKSELYHHSRSESI